MDNQFEEVSAELNKYQHYLDLKASTPSDINGLEDVYSKKYTLGQIGEIKTIVDNESKTLITLVPTLYDAKDFITIKAAKNETGSSYITDLDPKGLVCLEIESTLTPSKFTNKEYNSVVFKPLTKIVASSSFSEDYEEIIKSKVLHLKLTCDFVIGTGNLLNMAILLLNSYFRSNSLVIDGIRVFLKDIVTSNIPNLFYCVLDKTGEEVYMTIEPDRDHATYKDAVITFYYEPITKKISYFNYKANSNAEISSEALSQIIDEILAIIYKS